MIKIFQFIFSIIKIILFLRKEYIIIQCHHPKLYCDNSKYLYEYLIKNGSKNCYWNTSSKKISNYLKKKKFKYINFNENFLKFFFVTFKAKIVIDTGTKFFDPLQLISSDQKIIKISLYHGYGPKSVPYSKKNNAIKKIERKNHQSFNYINFTSNFLVNNFVKNFRLKKINCLNFGFPRIEFLRNKSKDNTFKYLTSTINKNSKIILYTPTWRPYNFNFPLNYMKGMDYLKFNKFLEDNDLYFFFSHHSIQNYDNKPKNYSRIIYIDHFKYPFYDPSSFMKSVSILINDYSATSTEFGMLKKPQIFYMPDYKKYNEYKGFLEDYKKNLIGFEVKDYKSFIFYIKKCIKNKRFYLKKFDKKLLSYQKKYYENPNIESCKLLKKFIEKI
jgi:teichoic acid glycerol-phosphate transferase